MKNTGGFASYVCLTGNSSNGCNGESLLSLQLTVA